MPSINIAVHPESRDRGGGDGTLSAPDRVGCPGPIQLTDYYGGAFTRCMVATRLDRLGINKAVADTGVQLLTELQACHTHQWRLGLLLAMKSLIVPRTCSLDSK
jgi:hypothetical protein